jgi:hypothetical protein
MEIVFDIEATGLLDTGSIEYKKYPFKLKPTFQVHCIVAKDLSNKGMIYSFTPENLWDFPHFFKKATKVVGHNIIDYDLMVVELFFGLKFDVDPFTIDGKEVEVCDTLVLSKLLNPDRSGGHGLAAWGERLSFYKDDFGKHTDWSEYSERMRSYCVQDVHLNHKVYAHLMLQEWRNWDWKEAFWLEQTCRHYITVQSHFGFQFDSTLATWCVGDLTQKMGDIEKKIEPLLPSKKMTKGSAKEFTPPKIQVKKNGDLSAHMQNFVAKHSLECKQDEYGDWVLIGYGRRWTLPMGQEPIFDTEPMRLADQDAIKQYLMSQGWEPTAWKEKDLTINTKKQKLSDEKYQIAVDRYIDQTVNGEYFSARIDHLKINAGELRRKLTDHNRKRPLRVLSTPSFTLGQEKKICSNLVALGAKFEWVADLVAWLTYRHRKNSIQSDKGTGWLNEDRILDDGRISTPADTLGTNTFRHTHKGVANVPRSTSTYGGYMRALFGVPADQYQIGSDAAGLEARVEAHFTRQFEGGEAYAKGLISEKPNDIHTVNAAKMGVDREVAKTLKYACLPVDSTTILTKSGWKGYNQLSVGQDVLTYNTSTGFNEWSPVKNILHYPDADVVSMRQRSFTFESTGDHRWFGSIRRAPKESPRYFEDLFKTTDEINTEFKIKNSAEYVGGGSHANVDEARLVAWILSDGYLKWSKDTRKTSSSFGNRRGVSCRISQDESKYAKEIEEVLESVGAEFSIHTLKNNPSFKTFILSPHWFREFWSRVGLPQQNKHNIDYLEWVCSLTRESLGGFVESFWQADGWTQAGGKCIGQNEGSVYEAILLASYLAGYSPKVSWGATVNKRRACITLSINQSRTCQRMIKTLSRNTDVFCIETANSTFVARQGDVVTITGNCSYGAQAGKIAKTLGVSKGEAEQVFESFWDASEPLKILKEHVATYWETKGHKVFIRGIDGRKLMTRSEHSLLNVLFQSTGAIVMKRQMVMYMRKLKDRNMYSNPFRESEILASQMMHYHDECQWQVSPKIIDMYTFDTKEEAESFEIEGKVLSNVKERGGVYTRGWSEVGQVFSETMAEAGQYYKFRVPLAADYDIGANWSETH